MAAGTFDLRGPIDAPSVGPDGQVAVLPPSGDHAGSEAPVGVVIARWLNPVISTDASREENPSPRLPVARVELKYISTLPFGAKVGPSTSQPSASSRSPLPSACITPMAKFYSSPPYRVKAF